MTNVWKKVVFFQLNHVTDLSLPAFPEEILKITIFHELHQNEDRLRLCHHSDQLNHIFCSKEEKQNKKNKEEKQRKNKEPLSTCIPPWWRLPEGS